MEHVQLDTDDRGVAWLTLRRPDVRNAMDAAMVDELRRAAYTIADDDRVRAVVLSGAGPSFSAGADLASMRSMADVGTEENLADARATAAMFHALNDLPCAVIGRVRGHAIGGGVGLVAVCDVAVAATDTTFALSEVRLGIAPAVVSPFVVRKIGPSHARALFVTGERFDAVHAERIGLVHHAVGADRVDATVARVVESVLAAGPHAVAAAKRLPELVAGPLRDTVEPTAQLIARLRTGDEGQEGMLAFLDRRPARWTVP